MSRLRTIRDGHAGRGQALVETAFMLPLILLVSLATFDLGRALFHHIALREATQEGALYAAYEPYPASDIMARVTTSSSNEAVAGATVTVPSCTTSPGTGQVVVRSTYEMPVVSPPAVLLFGSTVTLTEEITATNFNGDCS